MAVLHANHEALLTILEVLLYDPLYAWTLSPEKAAQLQLTRDLDQTADVTVDDVDEPHTSRSGSDERFQLFDFGALDIWCTVMFPYIFGFRVLLTFEYIFT